MTQRRERKKAGLLGVYNYTVWLTYLGLFISVGGIMAALHARRAAAVSCLALSGLCDAFDGRIARKKTDRTKAEKAFGIQIDSLCDMVCFGVFPAVLCFTFGVDGAAGLFVTALYCTCGVIRLAQFNVLADERLEKAEEAGYYRGLPITFVSVVLPVVYLLGMWLPPEAFVLLLHVMLAVMGLLFIIDLPFPKLRGKGLAVFICLVAAALLISLAGEGRI